MIVLRQSLVTLASLGKPFAVSGWQFLISYTSVSEEVFHYVPHLLLRQAGQLKPCIFAEYETRTDSILVRLEGIEQREQAARLSQTDIVIERQYLPDIEDGYYWHDLIGLEVIHKDHCGRENHYGKVRLMRSAGGRHDLLEVVDNQNRMTLIPFIEDRYITKVNFQTRKIEVYWPPEYRDL